MTWQFVPDNPKELTPARKGVSSSFLFHGTRLVLTSTGELFQSILRLGSSKWMDGGISLCSRERTVLMRPTKPEASAVCPRLDLTDPIRQKLFSEVYLRKALSRPLISIGSPNFVPVPWASIYDIVFGSTPASFQAASMTSAWAAAFGAVNPAEAPS